MQEFQLRVQNSNEQILGQYGQSELKVANLLKRLH
jgi:hypothetical protein